MISTEGNVKHYKCNNYQNRPNGQVKSTFFMLLTGGSLYAPLCSSVREPCPANNFKTIVVI
mgnify:CR=1 FL=1